MFGDLTLIKNYINSQKYFKEGYVILKLHGIFCQLLKLVIDFDKMQGIAFDLI